MREEVFFSAESIVPVVLASRMARRVKQPYDRWVKGIGFAVICQCIGTFFYRLNTCVGAKGPPQDAVIRGCSY